MSVFIDTSALYALLNRRERVHGDVLRIWAQLREEDQTLFTTSYVLAETAALVQNRLGMNTAREFHEAVAPALEVEWVDNQLHEQGVAALLAANRRDLSLVDCVSFAACRRAGVDRVFAFDGHFEEQGFTLLRAQP